MKNRILVFFTLISLIITTQAAAISNPPDNTIHKSGQEILKTQQTIKSASLRISLDDNLHGFVDSKMCSFCKTIRIIITPDTTAYNNNVKVPLKQAKKRIGRFATIVYDLKTKNVSAIRW
ncbi:MAG: hypothetical protein BMS9Abin19_0536 [Gammaproteobacteria bacterium]|nr:MAG: hypothetical protein BMS9Abin19_0536 [Gammaproteobacteria bacterium]